MAEIEIAILERIALSRRLEDGAALRAPAWWRWKPSLMSSGAVFGFKFTRVRCTPQAGAALSGERTLIGLTLTGQRPLLLSITSPLSLLFDQMVPLCSGPLFERSNRPMTEFAHTERLGCTNMLDPVSIRNSALDRAVPETGKLSQVTRCVSL
jgi:hypothetical protein